MLLAMEGKISNIFGIESFVSTHIKQENIYNKTFEKNKFCRVRIKPKKEETFFQNLKVIGLNPDEHMIILYKNHLDQNTFQITTNLNIDSIKNNILSIEQGDKIYYFLKINNITFISDSNENYMYIDSIKDREHLLGWKIKPSDKFGYRKIKVKGKIIDNFHSGVDLPAKNGTIIKFTHGTGIVKKVESNGYNGGYGLCVLIDCGDFEMMYAHLSDINVKKGDKIFNGDIIGKVGNTGWSYGAHLHLEFRVKLNRYDNSSLCMDKRKNKRGYIVVDPLNPIFKSIISSQQKKMIDSNIIYINNITKDLHVDNSNTELLVSQKQTTVRKINDQPRKIRIKSTSNKNIPISQKTIKKISIENLEEKKSPIKSQSRLIQQKSILKKEKIYTSKQNNNIKKRFINKMNNKNSKVTSMKNIKIKENASVRRMLESKKNAW